MPDRRPGRRPVTARQQVQVRRVAIPDDLARCCRFSRTTTQTCFSLGVAVDSDRRRTPAMPPPSTSTAGTRRSRRMDASGRMRPAESRTSWVSAGDVACAQIEGRDHEQVQQCRRGQTAQDHNCHRIFDLGSRNFSDMTSGTSARPVASAVMPCAFECGNTIPSGNVRCDTCHRETNATGMRQCQARETHSRTEAGPHPAQTPETRAKISQSRRSQRDKRRNRPEPVSSPPHSTTATPSYHVSTRFDQQRSLRLSGCRARTPVGSRRAR